MHAVFQTRATAHSHEEQTMTSATFTPLLSLASVKPKPYRDKNRDNKFLIVSLEEQLQMKLNLVGAFDFVPVWL